MTEPSPVFANGFFTVQENGVFNELILFEYYDPDGYYASVVSNQDRLDVELETLSRNMQFYLDLEKVLINGSESTPTVLNVSIGFRGDAKRPYILFIVSFKGDLVKGLNTYENYYEEEVAEYDYEVVWLFPGKARVVLADLGVPFKVEAGGRVLRFNVKKGTRIRGFEKILFEID
ncbi:hypothetical protein IMZ38_04070 [Thermosphaera chiliense]|uniref:Uncharacterized protein n=1 Tax=Thermosphaera chiliense TaxID=3402707 RepID=A0A7M1UQP4_9CREN|nr:hypothetical protein [Thermosphaera aggregans]QOR93837.1 hypothetical protein IMZ38_04070 [Thermosphaera aggregans]